MLTGFFLKGAPMDDAAKRRSITPEEVEEQIQLYEKRLETARATRQELSTKRYTALRRRLQVV
jgi:hypothetical protein